MQKRKWRIVSIRGGHRGEAREIGLVGMRGRVVVRIDIVRRRKVERIELGTVIMVREI